MTIDGELCSAVAAFDVEDPATGAVLGRAPDCTPELLDRAMSAAQRALQTWSGDPRLRRQALDECGVRLRAAADELAWLLTSEQGKPLTEARREVLGTARRFRLFARGESPQAATERVAGSLTEAWLRPKGVVAAITAANYPLWIALWKVGPALTAGNTVVLKPSPFTPLATLRFGQILNEVLPPGVLNVVTGGAELGRRMVAHPVPRHIAFTGSVETGSEVAGIATAGLKTTALELGGNDAAIILDDAVPEEITEDLFWAAFKNNGQICTAVKRVYAPARLYDRVVEALAARAKAAVVGDGRRPGVELGPLSNRGQHDRVAALVRDALERGARAAAGGLPDPDRGLFYEPTVLSGVPAHAPIVSQEQFGPALPVLRYDDLDEAVAAANASSFQLGASVWSSDPQRAAGTARRLAADAVWVNGHRTHSAKEPVGRTATGTAAPARPGFDLIHYLDVQPVLDYSSLGVIHHAEPA
ncbi:aldehyde dehydrogenase family protein [Streptacidiphilus sp. P02-A3a]|uniref:aldehyde dehydrogenase family protein n=1 Tax=Streptacidiphilus sp. P02-A3a TaxID=2704468 RepID=UPI0015FADE4A|nr:aldehyde dehydrogenase family protein [Streptacidiphilus sp. P02-A3a]QMU69780.1 aldehyde dehydrogenase family protein [Streptacidiphilus sp. P02-A3a]